MFGSKKNRPESKKDEPIEAHRSKDRTMRFSVDQLLREKGFAIEHRRPGEQAIWSRSGKKFTQAQALATVDPGELANAEMDSEYAEFCERDSRGK